MHSNFSHSLTHNHHHHQQQEQGKIKQSIKMIPPMDQPSSSSLRPSRLIKPDPAYEPGYPDPYPYPTLERKRSSPIYNPVINSPGISYSRFGNDTASTSASASAQEIGWDRDEFQSRGKRPYMIRWKSGKKVDQRLLVLLESYYQEIYVKRKDFFEKIFPGMDEEFKGVFRKIDDMLSRNSREVKNQTLQRSLSVGSPRRPERFKIKTPGVIIRGDQGGQQSSK